MELVFKKMYRISIIILKNHKVQDLRAVNHMTSRKTDLQLVGL
jgi:hypothetical protein